MAAPKHSDADAPHASSALPPAGAIRSVAQPIVRLEDSAVVGYEALARVDHPSQWGPDRWLDAADRAGVRAQLELEFLRSAARLGAPPGDALLFVNVSPAALSDPDLAGVRRLLPERLVLEITEQSAVEDYAAFKEHMAGWSSGQTRYAIDDAGAGYSSLRHVVELSPDFLKLDRTLIRDIDRDSHRNALVRALVAFAREVGTSVVAEGIETSGELAALMAAEVTLGQGYLLGRPGPAWPTLDATLRTWGGDGDPAPEAVLRAALTRARTPTSACEAVVSHLFRMGQAMPSLYLEQHGHLRCMAQRGLWQVLDGLPADGGITGRVWSTGEPIEAHDVTSYPGYLEAVPGAVAEVCVPVRVDGKVVGALNVDWLSPLPPGALRRLQDCAALLARRLGALGWHSGGSPWHRAVHGSVAISEAAADRDASARILDTLLVASGMDSAGLIRAGQGAPRLTQATGPLAGALRSMDARSLESVCQLVSRLSACYTGQEQTGLPYLGSEAIRDGGARAVVLLPLRTGNGSLGAVVLAHSRPMRLTAELVEPLELLAGQIAATLRAVDLVDQLRRRAQEDGLTGMLNRAALEMALDRSDGGRAVIVADLDHFKTVNDRFGHPSGDEALRALARGVAAAFPGLAFYRMGGDEFTCVIPGAGEREAEAVAERLRRLGRNVLAPWGTQLSVGAAASDMTETPADTLVRADAALMWAKKHARGEMVLAPRVSWSEALRPPAGKCP